MTIPSYLRISLIASSLLLGACGISSTPSPTTTTIYETVEPSTTASSPESLAIAQYWVADTALGFRLYREFVRLVPEPDPISAALTELFKGQPKDPDYASLWPNETKINSVAISGNSATIDLTLGKLNVGSEGEALAIAQLVWTATAAEPSVKQVRITVDGKTVESIAGHVDATRPFTRSPSYEVIAPVWITSPEDGARRSAVGFKLTGLASTFEANVAWKIFQDGKVIREGSTLALKAAPAWAPWSVAIDGLGPGTYEFAAMEFSAKDGALIAQDTKKVTLTAQ